MDDALTYDEIMRARAVVPDAKPANVPVVEVVGKRPQPLEQPRQRIRRSRQVLPESWWFGDLSTSS